jgi:hypothetical protein
VGKVIWEASDELSGTAQPRAPGAPFEEPRVNSVRRTVATTIGILALVAASCISGCPTGSSPTDGTLETTAPTLDLSAGGTIAAGAGVTIQALPNSALGEIAVSAAATGAAGEKNENGRICSLEYEITATGLTSKVLTAPLLVTLPVDVTGIPSPVDPYAFFIETYDEATGAWIPASGRIPYDAAASTVTFPTAHFSKYRVLYVGLIPEGELNYLDGNDTPLKKYTYTTDHFVIPYYLPASFGQTSKHVVVDNATWGTGGGHATDAEVPDYIEDLAFALEQAHAYLLGLKVGGQAVFNDPGRVACEVMSIPDASGKFSWWEDNLIRVRPTLDNFNELQGTVAHELTHLFCTQHYNFAGAVSNRWFYEAVANWWAVRACKLGRADMLTAFRDGISTFIAEPLDTASEGSMYAAADFLYALTNAVPGFGAANVILANQSSDLLALEQVLTNLNVPLGDIFTQYVQQNCVGTYDLAPGYLKFSKRLTTVELGWRHEFTQNHLSGHFVELSCEEAIDGLLVAAPTCGSSALPFNHYSYADTSPAPARSDVNTYLEAPDALQAALAVQHFGKKGTPGVRYSVFRQVFVNPHTGTDQDDVACGADYYLLEPPPLSTGAWPTNGVGWVFAAPNIDPSYLTGFNVYLNNKRINDNPIPYTGEQSYSYTSAANPITSRTGVTVTIVDKFGHEWPELQGARASLDIPEQTEAFVLDWWQTPRPTITTSGAVTPTGLTTGVRDPRWASEISSDLLVAQMDALSRSTSTPRVFTAEISGPSAELTFRVIETGDSGTGTQSGGFGRPHEHTYTVTSRSYLLETLDANGGVIETVPASSGQFKKTFARGDGVSKVRVRWSVEVTHSDTYQAEVGNGDTTLVTKTDVTQETLGGDALILTLTYK